LFGAAEKAFHDSRDTEAGSRVPGCDCGLSGETNMRELFILFALVFALVTTATATLVTTAVISDTNQVRGG
jgi:hypothetical protein